MFSSLNEVRAVARVAELEPAVARLEFHLASLAAAMCRHDAAAIEIEAGALHKALAFALGEFGQAAREGGAPPQLRQRLIAASGQVAALREGLARATASLDRAIDVLLPEHGGAGMYDLHGSSVRHSSGGVQA
jgi:hypothetical protein